MFVLQFYEILFMNVGIVVMRDSENGFKYFDKF